MPQSCLDEAPRGPCSQPSPPSLNLLSNLPLVQVLALISAFPFPEQFRPLCPVTATHLGGVPPLALPLTVNQPVILEG